LRPGDEAFTTFFTLLPRPPAKACNFGQQRLLNDEQPRFLTISPLIRLKSDDTIDALLYLMEHEPYHRLSLTGLSQFEHARLHHFTTLGRYRAISN